MSTRISFSSINTRVLDRLTMNYNKLETIQDQLSTGKRISRPSDDPVAVAGSMELKSQLDQFNTYNRNIDDGLAYLGTVDTTLNTGNNLYQGMRERAIQASNDSNSAESRAYIGQEIRGMFDQMVALANTAFKGEYVFSGTNSQVPPYEVRSGSALVASAAPGTTGNMQLTGPQLNVPMRLRDKGVTDSELTSNYADAYQIIPGTFQVGGLTEGTDFNVDYVNGTVTFLTANAVTAANTGSGISMTFDWLRRNEKDMDGTINREVEEGVAAPLNTTASQVFGSTGPTNSWAAMINLMEGTLKNKPDKIRASIGTLDQSLSRQLNAMATNGARVNRFESTQERNDQRIVYSTKLKSDVEDVDFAEAVTQFSLQQAVYQASLQMGSRAIQQTLANFL